MVNRSVEAAKAINHGKMINVAASSTMFRPSLDAGGLRLTIGQAAMQRLRSGKFPVLAVNAEKQRPR
ncbi:MAG: hypothetical protein JO163_11905 [Methylobacteriaceae bacterium]|nr:hypothetical protein [Methylobacteriaceae bacterium]